MLGLSVARQRLSAVFPAAAIIFCFGFFNAAATYRAFNSGTRELGNSGTRELGNSGTRELDEPSTDGGLVFSREDLDFGVAEPQVAFHWSVPMKNATDRDIHVKSFGFSCLCTSVSPTSLTVPARGSAEVRVMLNLLPRAPFEAMGRDRSFSVHITPRIDGLPPLQGFDLRGTVRSPLGVYPPSMAFGQIVRGTATAPIKVTARSSEILDSLEATSETAFLKVSARREGREPNSYEISAAPDGSMPAGRFEAGICLRARTQSGKTIVAVAIPVVAEVIEDACVVPSTLILDCADESGAAAVVEFGSRSGVAIANVEAQSSEACLVRLEWLAGENKKTRRARIRIAGEPRRAVEHVRLPFSVWRSGDAQPVTAELSVIVRGAKPVFRDLASRRGNDHSGENGDD